MDWPPSKQALRKPQAPGPGNESIRSEALGLRIHISDAASIVKSLSRVVYGVDGYSLAGWSDLTRILEEPSREFTYEHRKLFTRLSGRDPDTVSLRDQLPTLGPQFAAEDVSPEAMLRFIAGATADLETRREQLWNDVERSPRDQAVALTI